MESALFLFYAEIMKPWAKKLYTSAAWVKCREAYKQSVGGLCERCLKAGQIVPGEIVHHKAHLTPETVDDPAVALNFDNLELLCRECHAAEHELTRRRWKIDAEGRAVAIR